MAHRSHRPASAPGWAFAAVTRWLWWVVHAYFTARSFGRAALDAAFRALGLAHLEPRRGLGFCARKLRRVWELGARSASACGPDGAPPPPPEVLAVVVNDPDDASRCLAPIASLLTWAADAGIRHVCVYDQDGYAREGAERLAELVVRAATVVRGNANGGGRSATRRRVDRTPVACTYTFRVAAEDGVLLPAQRFACGGDATCTPETSLSKGAPLSRRRGRGRGRGRGIGNGNGEGAAVSSSGGGGSSGDEGDVPATSGGRREVSVCVDLLRGGDGGVGLLDAARRWGEVAEDAGDGSRGTGPVARLERWMDRRGSLLPAADVAVVFGKHFHLSGYPAWQMHRAEIYHRRDLRGFDREGLREILRRYANVSKRHGK